MNSEQKREWQMKVNKEGSDIMNNEQERKW